MASKGSQDSMRVGGGLVIACSFGISDHKLLPLDL
jgi:hypothetical protein